MVGSGKWAVVGTFFVATAAGGMAQLMTAPLAPFLLNDFGLSRVELGFLLSLPAWGPVGMAMVWGWLCDRVGEMIVFFFGAATMAGGVFVFSLGEDVAGLAAGVLVVGIGFACLLPLTNRGIAWWFPGHQRALAIGVKQGGLPTGIALAAAFLPRLAATEGWRLAARYLGLGILVTGLTCALAYGLLFRVRFPRLERAGAVPEPRSSGGPRLPGAARGAAGWNRPAVALVVMGFSFMVVQHSVSAFTVPYFREALGFSELTCGYYLALLQIAEGMSRPAYGFLTDYVLEDRRVALVYLAVLIVLVIAVFSGTTVACPAYLIGVVTFPLGFAALAWFAPYYALLTDVLGTKRAGLASGLGQSVNSVGAAVAGPVFGWIVDATGSYRLAWRAFALWLLLAAVAFQVLSRTHARSVWLFPKPRERAGRQTKRRRACAH